MPKPLLSVIVPNYNHSHFLQERIESILNQRFTNFELLILDDASLDDSHKVIRQYLQNSKVAFYPNSRNSGSPFFQWNKGVNLAAGKYIWIAESDDRASPEFLETLLPALESDKDIGLAYCQSYQIDETGSNLGPLVHWTADLSPERWHKSFTNDGRDEIARYLVRKNTILNASSVVFRRDLYHRAGGAPTNFRECGDWVTWARMLSHSNLAFEARPLNFFRTHSGNVRSSTRGAASFQEFVRARESIIAMVKLDAATEFDVCHRTLSSLLALIRARPRAPMIPLAKCLISTLGFASTRPVTCSRAIIRHLSGRS